MKFARQCGQLLLLALLSPGLALALGLGDIHLKSTLNAPLDADIDLVDADAEDLSGLKATLASHDTFKRLGADYPSFLGTVTLTPERAADGHTVLHVRSAGVADEPFATLLVEVDWPRGHVVREYTVLLDPPVFNSQAQSNAGVAAPVAGATDRGGLVEHAPDNASTNAASGASGASSPDNSQAATAASAANGSAPGAPSAPSAGTSAADSDAASPSTTASNAPSASGNSSASSTPSSTGGSSEAGNPGASEGSASAAAGSHGSATHVASHYTVRRGDTLSRIADQNYGSDAATRARALVAIYRANRKAFHDNMNLLYSGAVLQLPGDSELEAIGPGEAIAEVRHQYDTFRGEHGASAGTDTAQNAAGAHGQLRLVAPQEGGEPAPAASPSPSASSAASAAGAGGTGKGAGSAALQQRVQQLESQLAESQRLLQLKSAELEALQARVQQQAQPNGTAPATPPIAPPQAPAVATAPPSVPAATASAPNVPAPAPPVATPAPGQPPAVAASGAPHVAPAPPVGGAAAAHRPRVPAHTVRPVKPAGGSMGDLLQQYWYIPAALIALLLAALTLRWVRSRREDAFDRSLGELSDAPEEEPTSPRTDTVPVRTITGVREEPSYHVEESGTHPRPDFDHLTDAEAPAQPHEQVAVEEAVPAEAPVALDQGDPMAEADFHMAYGLYDQAAELVQIAINRDPKRRDLKLKLLEVFFVWGNRDRFLQTARDLAATRDQAPAGEWEKLLIMGRQIAPDDAMFADSRGMAGAAKVVDLNLEGGQNRVDFDLLGEPSLGASGQDNSVELDLGAALAHPTATEATGEAPQIHGDGIDFPLEPAHVDGTGTTREMPEALSANARAASGGRPTAPATSSTETVRVVMETEAPTVEQPQLRSGDHGTIRQKIDAAARHAMTNGEQTAELAIDDLGLDLGALDGTDEPLSEAADADAPTMLADVDEDTRRMFEAAETKGGAEQRSGAAAVSAPKPAVAPQRIAAQAKAGEVASAGSSEVTQRAPAAAVGRGTGTWMFTDTDFASIAPVTKPSPTVITQIAPAPQVDGSSTSVALKALRGNDLDLDLGATQSAKSSANGVDLDVGASGEGSFVDTQKLSADAVVSDDMALPDLEPVTLSEVGTKLDLARAYMDMGDPEGARSILAEVMSEGSVSQKQEARRLIDALPG